MKKPFIVVISNELRDSLEESLDRYNTSTKKRPYYLSFIINKEIVILLPIRSKISREYGISLKVSDDKKPNPGIDCLKMIIIPYTELSNCTKRGFVDSITAEDIIKKRPIILNTIKKTIQDYQVMLEKTSKGMDLNKKEKLLKNRSTLRNYKELISKIKL